MGPTSTLCKGGNGGSEGFEEVGPLVQVLGFGEGRRRGGTTCRVLSGPRLPWLATSSLPLPPGGGCSASKERSREERGWVAGGRAWRVMGEGQHRRIAGGRAGREASRGQHRWIAGGHAGREARRGQHRRIAGGRAGREASRGQHRWIAGGHAGREARRGQHRRIAGGRARRVARRGQHRRIAGHGWGEGCGGAGGWGVHLVWQWCVCPSQAAPLTPGGA